MRRFLSNNGWTLGLGGLLVLLLAATKLIQPEFGVSGLDLQWSPCYQLDSPIVEIRHCDSLANDSFVFQEKRHAATQRATR